MVANDIEHVNQGVVVDLEQSDGQDERVVDAEGEAGDLPVEAVPDKPRE